MNKLISIAKSYIGVREGTPAHIALVNEYNKIRPLPAGYKCNTSDNWCALFASVCMKKAGIKNAPYECGAERMRRKCKTTKTPKEGYLVFYDWNGNGIAQHVGIVESVSRGTFTAIEGNNANAVRRRSAKTTSKHVLCFGVVETETMTEQQDLTAVAKDVIRGKYGNGEARRVMLAAAGYDYRAVQAEVSRIYKANKR